MNIVPVVGKVITTYAAEVILTLDEMKSICYIDTEITDDDAMLQQWEIAARNLCEQFLGRPLLTSTTSIWYNHCSIYELMAYRSDSILNLPLGELQAIGDVNIYGTDDVSTTLPNDNTVYTTSVNDPLGGRVNFLQTPFTYSSTIRELDALEIKVTAGFGDDATYVPEAIKQGSLFLIAYWYEHREDQKLGSITPSAKAAWSPYRLQRVK